MIFHGDWSNETKNEGVAVTLTEIGWYWQASAVKCGAYIDIEHLRNGAIEWDKVAVLEPLAQVYTVAI